MNEVSAMDLKSGTKYYMQNKNYTTRLWGIFSHNTIPYKNNGIVSMFTPHCIDKVCSHLILHEKHWRFYERTAVHDAWVNAVLRSILGDPYFTYYQKP